jgi:MerR family transcriptional regulator, light-induced transcriptional regulator
MEHLKLFQEKLNAYDKDACVSLVHGWIDSNELDLITVYEKILGLAMLDVRSKEEDPSHKIWNEHMKTQILRTVIESLYPDVMAQSPIVSPQKVAILCPEGEYHELGARIVADYFRMLGYAGCFFGNSLPKDEIADLIASVDFAYLVFSVNNFFSLSALNASLRVINLNRPDLKIILGGQALKHNEAMIVAKNVAICQTFDELKSFLEGAKV